MGLKRGGIFGKFIRYMSSLRRRKEIDKTGSTGRRKSDYKLVDEDGEKGDHEAAEG